MVRSLVLATLVLGFGLVGCSGGGEKTGSTSGGEEAAADTLRLVEEIRLKNIRQLTFGGENAEAYFSPDGKQLVLQSTRPPFECDQIFRMPLDGGEAVLVSNGEGRTTCAYFMPDGETIIYSSTHLASPNCPPRADFSQGYVWAIYAGFDIFSVDPSGTVVRLTETPGYDAEATVSPRGDKVVFTSVRSGDIDIYSMNLDGSGVTQLTSEPGYEGGPFYSPDGSEIVFRAFYPQTNEERGDYTSLLERGLIRPGILNLYVMDADGTNRKTVLENGAANFAPYFFPDGERIIFCSNLSDPEGRNFDLYMVKKDGSSLQRVTYNPSFDGFPMFSPDGRYLVFASNRNNQNPRDTNVFIAEWIGQQ